MKSYFLLLLFLGTFWASCKKDNSSENTDYTVNITIEQPTANATITVNESLPVKVNFSRGAEEVIHHVKIFVLDENGNTIETLLNEHAHVVANYSYNNASAYTPTTSGTYTIKAVSHDMEDQYATPVEVTFTVNN